MKMSPGPMLGLAVRIVTGGGVVGAAAAAAGASASAAPAIVSAYCHRERLGDIGVTPFGLF
jgi:hypothetical protein